MLVGYAPPPLGSHGFFGAKTHQSWTSEDPDDTLQLSQLCSSPSFCAIWLFFSRTSLRLGSLHAWLWDQWDNLTLQRGGNGTGRNQLIPV